MGSRQFSVLFRPLALHPGEGLHHPVQHHRHPVIEDALSEHQEVEVGVDPNLSKNGKDGHGVHRGDEAGEEEGLHGCDGGGGETCGDHCHHQATNQEEVEDSSHHREQQYRPDVTEEVLVVERP